MVSFSDKFDRTDRDLDGDNNWQVIGANDGTASVLEIKQGYVTNTDTFAGYAAQELAANAPDTTDQKIEAWVSSSEEGASTYVRIGVGGETVPSSQEWDDRGRMAFVELAYKASGERTLTIKHKVGAATSETTLATLTMVAAGSIVQEGYVGKLLDSGALNTLQHLRFIVTAVDAGLRLAAYVNNEDDDHPTLEAILRSDFDVGTGFTETYGYWWFELSPTSAAEALVLSQFEAEDYAIADRKATIQKDYYPTVGEVVERIKRRFSGGSQIDIEDSHLIELVGDELEQIILEMGDECWFLIIQETLSLSWDQNGFVTLPAYVERPIAVEKVSDRRPSWFDFSHHDSAGNVVIRLDYHHEESTTDFFVRFLQRWIRPQHPLDQLPLPKKHVQVLVYAVCRVLSAIRERSGPLEQSFTMLYQERLIALKREQARFWRQTHTRMHPRRRGKPLGRWWY